MMGLMNDKLEHYFMALARNDPGQTEIKKHEKTSNESASTCVGCTSKQQWRI
jgi:hypothetical protein